MTALTYEKKFQKDIIGDMQSLGWQLGSNCDYDRHHAIIPADALHYVQTTQPDEWQKFCGIYPTDTEKHFISTLVKQLSKADPNATDQVSRTCGTLGVLRHGLKTRNVRFSLCQFKPENHLNPTIVANYQHNICRIIPELVYSPYASPAELAETGNASKKYRIDLVLFVNGLPVATLELKSEFKQTVQDAISQYRQTRQPRYANNKPEPLLTFKRGAIVHFAVSQDQVYMTTRLAGNDSVFLPFNRGTSAGGAGNDVPDDSNQYATAYLWNEVLSPDSLLNILGRYVHLHIRTSTDWQGIRQTSEQMIFPRFHQWRAVNRLLQDARQHGAGQRYLIQHSAGSGKSNSIAWLAHQLSSLHDRADRPLFDSVIVITDRTVLDDQLQDTIYQFEHRDGVVGRINRKEGSGSKSEKLADALVNSKRIIIVTIQTFNHVLDAIEKSETLKHKRYAIIADEAHSSQTGKTAGEIKRVLNKDDDSEEQSAEDALNDLMALRKPSPNISYYAFTATPKPRTMELFGHLPDPTMPPSKENRPFGFDVYSMRQAIEEGFILDVLRNYTNYKVMYNLKMKLEKLDHEVDRKKARVRLSQWVRLHEYNIAQKVKAIIEHFRQHVMHLLNHQAKAMVVTGSRKEAVRYKLAFDQYIAENAIQGVQAMVAFSGEVTFTANDPDSSGLVGERFTELSPRMNPSLKGSDMREAFDTPDYQVMLVANKFQTGFDQPKLCAMYVDKKLGGVDCVQTLSRLNRTYPGKDKTFVLDFYNDPQDVLAAFQPYYEIATLEDVSDPDYVLELLEQLRSTDIYDWADVENFVTIFLTEKKSDAYVVNLLKPIVKRWQDLYRQRAQAHKEAMRQLKAQQTAKADKVNLANSKKAIQDAKKAVEQLVLLKKNLGKYLRTYEFMSQIAEYDDPDLEKLSLFGGLLLPLLREEVLDQDEIDLSNVMMSHYRLSKIREQDLKLEKDTDSPLPPGTGGGTAVPRGREDDLLSEIIRRLNEIFITDNLTDSDMINYAYTVRDKLLENKIVMKQIRQNSREQALLGDLPQAVDDAILSSSQAHDEQKMQLLTDPAKSNLFMQVIYDMLRVNAAQSLV